MRWHLLVKGERESVKEERGAEIVKGREWKRKEGWWWDMLKEHQNRDGESNERVRGEEKNEKL